MHRLRFGMESFQVEVISSGPKYFAIQYFIASVQLYLNLPQSVGLTVLGGAVRWV